MSFQLNDTTNLIGIMQDIYFLAKINVNTFNPLDLKRIINKYYKNTQEQLRAENESYFIKVFATNLLYTPNSYTIQSDWEKIKQLQVSMNPANINNPLATEYKRVQIIDANSFTDPSYTFTSPTAVMYDNYFYLYPIPTVNQTVVNGIKIYAIPDQTDLLNDTDIPNIPSGFHDIIGIGSLIDIARRIGNDRLLSEAKEEFKKRMAELMSHAASRVEDYQSGIIEGQSNDKWSYPWGQQSMS